MVYDWSTTLPWWASKHWFKTRKKYGNNQQIYIYSYDFHGINTNKNQNLICPGMVDTPVCGSSIPIFKQTYASGKDGGGLAGQKSARMMTQKFLLGTQHHSKTHSRHHLSPKKGAHQHEFWSFVPIFAHHHSLMVHPIRVAYFFFCLPKFLTLLPIWANCPVLGYWHAHIVGYQSHYLPSYYPMISSWNDWFHTPKYPVKSSSVYC